MRAPSIREPKLAVGPDLVKLIAEMDEFKGRWEALEMLSPDRLSALRKVATAESVGCSTRIEGSKLSDAEVEDLLSLAISIKSFKTRDEQEVAGYAEVMDLVFEAYADCIPKSAQSERIDMSKGYRVLKQLSNWRVS